MRPRTGLAEVNTRAGWTMRLHFYWVRPRGLLDSAVAGSERGAVLVDTPGYGHAVGEKAELRHWRSLIEAYVDGSSSLQLGLLLVDSTRGLCDADGRVLRLLRKRRVPTLVALTKCDLLTPDELARSHAVVQAQVDEALQGGEGGIGSDVPLLLLSSHFYGGVERLWEELAARLQPTAAQGYKAGGRPGGPWDVGGRGGGEHEVEEVAASRGS
jgi:GTP-binding protein